MRIIHLGQLVTTGDDRGNQAPSNGAFRTCSPHPGMDVGLDEASMPPDLRGRNWGVWIPEDYTLCNPNPRGNNFEILLKAAHITRPGDEGFECPPCWVVDRSYRDGRLVSYRCVQPSINYGLCLNEFKSAWNKYKAGNPDVQAVATTPQMCPGGLDSVTYCLNRAASLDPMEGCCVGPLLAAGGVIVAIWMLLF